MTWDLWKEFLQFHVGRPWNVAGQLSLTVSLLLPILPFSKEATIQNKVGDLLLGMVDVSRKKLQYDTYNMWRFIWEMSSIGSGIWTFDPQGKALFWRLKRSSLAEGTVSLECDFESSQLHPDSAFLSFPCWWWSMWSLSVLILPPCLLLAALHANSSMTNSYLSGTISQANSFLYKLLVVSLY